MAGSRLITISKAELSPNPVQTGKSYVIRVTLEKKAYWLDYPYDYAHDYAKGDESMSVKTVQAVINGQTYTLTKKHQHRQVRSNHYSSVKIQLYLIRTLVSGNGKSNR